MRFRASVLAAVLIAAGGSGASAAVSESQFPPHTVADLTAICAPAKDDPRLVPGVLFCNRKIAEEKLAIVDVAPTILKMFGLALPSYFDGKPWTVTSSVAP